MRRWLSRLLGRQEMRERLMRLESQIAQLSETTAALRGELAAARAAADAAPHRTAEIVVAQVEDAMVTQIDRLDGYLVHHADRILAALPPSSAASGSVEAAEPGRPVPSMGRPVDLSRS